MVLCCTITWSCCSSAQVGGDICIGLSCILIQDQNAATHPHLFRDLQYIFGLPATRIINHPLTPGWSAGSWGDPGCLFVYRLLNCLEKRWYCWHWLHHCRALVTHIPYIMPSCTVWRKHLYEWKNWGGTLFCCLQHRNNSSNGESLH